MNNQKKNRDECQEVSAMGNYKEHPKYNIISIRVTDEEKAFFEKIKRHTRKNMTMIIREAMHLYYPYAELSANRPK